MKKNYYLSVIAAMMMLATGCTFVACDEYDDEPEYEGGMYSFGTMDGVPTPGGEMPGGNPNNKNTEAGIVTAGEWNDLANWAFWSKLMAGNSFADKSSYWECYTNHRVAVEVTDGKGNALAGVPVVLVRTNDGKQSTLWETVTDNHGQANCWFSLWQKSERADANTLRVNIAGQLMDQKPVVCDWDSLGQLTVNRYVCETAVAVKQQADIAFVVDATGSMADEIDFLKSDLKDIIGKVSSLRPGTTIRTSALFYRDEGDEYLTRHSDFTTEVSTTADFVNKQSADGGGDYPEAVHTALDRMLKDLSWDSSARTRLAFLILDAPAHHETDVIRSLQQSVQACAQRGIRLIPVSASGVDKNTEFMLRFYAIVTGGTYVFLTNDSGVGLPHIQATVGDYEVEQLNSLIIRLINHYTE